MLALFVNFFNYTPDSFELLTPRQASEILLMKVELDDAKYTYFDTQFRLVNYFTIKSAFGDTKHINKPSDLYSLPIDEKLTDTTTEKLIEMDEQGLTDFEKQLISSL